MMPYNLVRKKEFGGHHATIDTGEKLSSGDFVCSDRLVAFDETERRTPKDGDVLREGKVNHHVYLSNFYGIAKGDPTWG